MRRRAIFIAVAVFFIGVVVYMGAGYVKVPNVTFAQAAKVDGEVSDEKKQKVLVTGRVLPNRDISDDGGAVTFYMTDASGEESKIFYDGPDSLDTAKLRSVAQQGKQVRVAGHVCGDRFHISTVYFL